MLNDDGGDLDVSIDDVVQLEGADGRWPPAVLFTVAFRAEPLSRP